MTLKEKVAVYGAGEMAKTLLPLILQRYDVSYILDKMLGDKADCLFGIDIKQPTTNNVNQYPIIVLIADGKSCLDTLNRLECKQPIFIVLYVLNGFVLFEYKNQCINNYKIFTDEQHELVDFSATTQKYINEKRRCFVLCQRSPKGLLTDGGGPAAGVRLLLESNNSMGLIDNFYAVVPGLIYTPQNAPIKHNGHYAATSKEIAAIKISNYPQQDKATKLEESFATTKSFLQQTGKILGFSPDDIFLIFDSFMARAFMYTFPNMKKVVLSYHAQGSLRTELSKHSPDLGDKYDAMQSEQLDKIKYWIFPTQGAMDGFITSASDRLKSHINRENFRVLYTSYTPKKTINPDKSFVKAMDELEDYDVMFASATHLYIGKGVERIPRILALFREQTGLRIKWILVGNGEMEAEVQSSIEKYLLPQDYIWYKKRFDNQDNIFELFTRADFYIMMHHISISDISTLQAMSYGCVPFLSNVGGNKEFVGFGNGILVEPDTDALPLAQYFSSGRLNIEYLEQQKKHNKDIIREKFSERSFLQGYSTFLNTL